MNFFQAVIRLFFGIVIVTAVKVVDDLSFVLGVPIPSMDTGLLI